MKQLKLHIIAFLMLIPCLLILAEDNLWSTAIGLLYIAVMVMVSRTPRGRQFIRRYYREILRLERGL